MKKILLVEDEKVLGEMYQEKLRAAGFEVLWVIAAEDAWEALKKAERPDLVLMDVLLPRENGLWLLQEIRKNPETASLRVVAFSNFDDLETKKQAFKLGVEDYLIKTNYTPQEIIEKIRTYFKDDEQNSNS